MKRRNNKARNFFKKSFISLTNVLVEYEPISGAKILTAKFIGSS